MSVVKESQKRKETKFLWTCLSVSFLWSSCSWLFLAIQPQIQIQLQRTAIVKKNNFSSTQIFKSCSTLNQIRKSSFIVDGSGRGRIFRPPTATTSQLRPKGLWTGHQISQSSILILPTITVTNIQTTKATSSGKTLSIILISRNSLLITKF